MLGKVFYCQAYMSCASLGTTLVQITLGTVVVCSLNSMIAISFYIVISRLLLISVLAQAGLFVVCWCGSYI